MAGFDLTFEIPARFRSEGKRWMDYLQRLAARYRLEVRYQTKLLGKGRVEVYTTVVYNNNI